MKKTPPVITRFAVVQPDSISGDAFGRLRTSGTGQRLDVEFIYNKNPDFFDETTNNGTVTFNGNSRDLTLSLSDANNGSHATMRSHPVPYTPGNSQLIDMTGVLDYAAIGGGNAEVFLRSKVTGSVVETVIDQSDWYETPVGIDWTKDQIFTMDFQSLKTGRIRYGLILDGVINYVAEIQNDNRKTSGYWQLPSLPCYWRIYNDSTYTYMEIGYGNEDNAIGFRYKILANASATMRGICCTVKSEGGMNLSEMNGLHRNVDTGTSNTSVSSTLIPILSIRLKSTFQTYDNLTIAIPRGISIKTSQDIKIAVIHSGSLTGASWSDADSTYSAVEYDTSATAITGGHTLYSKYISSSGNNKLDDSKSLLGKTVLWNRQSSETGIITIAGIKTGSQDSDVLAAINWEEIR